MFVYVFVKDGNINDILFVLQTCIFLFFYFCMCLSRSYCIYLEI